MVGLCAAHAMCARLQEVVGMSEATFHELLGQDCGAAEKLQASLLAAAEAQEELEARLQRKAADWSLELLPSRAVVYSH